MQVSNYVAEFHMATNEPKPQEPGEAPRTLWELIATLTEKNVPRPACLQTFD
jgi:hypothetical protein